MFCPKPVFLGGKQSQKNRKINSLYFRGAPKEFFFFGFILYYSDYYDSNIRNTHPK